MGEFGLAFAIIVIAAVVIMYACNSFEEASSYLGRNMAPGVKGATINAVASSMPELMTAMFLLFLYHDKDGFSAGIATTAGSAVFNSVIIPMVCIFAVRYYGTEPGKGQIGVAGNVIKEAREKVKEIVISRRALFRDGLFLLMAEAALIWFLGGTTMAWWMGGGLMVIYVFYFLVLMRGFGVEADDDEDEDEGDDSESDESKLKALITFDFNNLLFDGRAFSTSTAWTVLVLTTTVMGLACWALADAVIMSANAIGVPAYFTAVILAAAATSVPDTVISFKDAVKGEYNDALSNAIGSNTFDITVALGLPLLLYGAIYGDVSLSTQDGVTANVQLLRIILLCVTIVVLAAFLLPRRITVATAYWFGLIFVGWVGFIIYEAVRWTTTA